MNLKKAVTDCQNVQQLSISNNNKQIATSNVMQRRMVHICGVLFYFFKKKKSVDFFQVHYLYVANLFGCDFTDNQIDSLCVMNSWRSTAIQPKNII